MVKLGRMIDGNPVRSSTCQRLVHRMRDARPRRFQPDLGHRIAELDPVLGLVDGLGIGTDHLDAVFRQRAVVEQRQSGIQRGLPAHRRQHRVRAALSR